MDNTTMTYAFEDDTSTPDSNAFDRFALILIECGIVSNCDH
jgi:hypothetical protein